MDIACDVTTMKPEYPSAESMLRRWKYPQTNCKGRGTAPVRDSALNSENGSGVKHAPRAARGAVMKQRSKRFLEDLIGYLLLPAPLYSQVRQARREEEKRRTQSEEESK
jgi:hypothetical protein